MAPIDPNFLPDFLRDEHLPPPVVLPPEPLRDWTASAAARSLAEREERRIASAKAWAEECRLRRERLVARARAAATESLRERPWAWATAALIAEAEALLALEVLVEPDAERLLKLAKAADAAAAKALEASAVPVPTEAELARDPAIREACRLGLHYITVLDSDRARVTNDSGWSRSTTVMGHVLDALPELDEAQASHALRILRIHRRQLPDILAGAVFEGLTLPPRRLHMSPISTSGARA